MFESCRSLPHHNHNWTAENVGARVFQGLFVDRLIRPSYYSSFLLMSQSLTVFYVAFYIGVWRVEAWRDYIASLNDLEKLIFRILCKKFWWKKLPQLQKFLYSWWNRASVRHNGLKRGDSLLVELGRGQVLLQIFPSIDWCLRDCQWMSSLKALVQGRRQMGDCKFCWNRF